MGLTQSIMNSHRVVTKSEGKEVMLEQHPPPEMLEFDPKHSYIVSYGIDYQTSPKFKDKTLSPIAGFDAVHFASVFKKVAGISGSNTNCLVASQCPEDCTFEGIKNTFQKQANKVDLDGTFVFYFAGHGLKVGKDKWGLAPVDFDYTEEKLITGTHLADWLHHVRFQGRAAIFFLDCCYAEGLAIELTKGVVTEDIPIPNLCVITSCSANEASLVLSSLNHSIFNFFLTSVMFNLPTAQQGRLPLRDVFDECYQLCAALSSLLMSNKPDKGLGWGTMQPKFNYFDLSAYLNSLLEADGEEATDAAGPHRFQFVLSYYDYSFKASRNPIHDKCLAWLETVADPRGPLAVLQQHNFLADEVLTAALYAMLYSVALILVSCQQPHVEDPNLFIILFIHVCASIDRIHTELSPSLRNLRIGIEYYHDALRKNKIKSRGLVQLYSRVVHDEAAQCGVESTDSAKEMNGSQPITDIPAPTFWEPAIWP